MCGIAGILALNDRAAAPQREALLAMAAVQAHRGPDEFGLFRDRHCGFAHARLAIVDLQTGQQPMGNASGSLWLVFNGEIYNHVELRVELEQLGCVFRTHSDTEVILHAWSQWGEAAFERMNGQWAVALWDRSARRLVLARDPIGICPLHWCEHGGRLYFASEVKAIFAADASIPRAFDPIGLAQTFTFWSIVPPQGVYAGVQEVRPGHVRSYTLGAAGPVHGVERPYHVALPPVDGMGRFAGSLDDAVAVVRDALQQATRLRMLRADVPVGSYLSGGLDSSLIAAMGRAWAGDSFQTFSLRFADAEYDETEFQRLMVQRLGSIHHEVVITRQDIAAVFPEVVAQTERPILRTAPAPMFLLSRLVRQQGIKVVLTGEGADEMFAGYDLFREAKVRRFWGRQPQSAWRPRLIERLYPYLARSPVAQRAMTQQFFGRGIERHAHIGFGHDMRWQTTAALQRLLAPELRAQLQAVRPVEQFLAELPPQATRWDALAQDQQIEIRTLLAGYLISSQGDRMLLGNSVEGRFPFLDRDVMALAHSLPPAYKLKVLDEKHIIKRVAREWVEPAILDRKKQPYRAPDALCFVGPDAPGYVDEVLSESAVRACGVFDARAISQLLGKCRARAGDAQLSNTDNMALVAAVSTQLLHQTYIAARPCTTASVPLRTDVDLSAA